MRIDVLNGVNLDMLGRRDPAIYGDITLPTSRRRSTRGRSELECTVRCRQTNHEGEYVEWCHDALDWADGADRQPGRLDALLLGDPRRARDLHRAGRRGAPVERRRARGVAPPLGARRPRRRRGSSARAPTATARRWSSSSQARRRREPARPPARAASRRRCSSRARQRPLPDRASTARTRAARRAGARARSSPTSATSSGARAVDGVEAVQVARDVIGDARRAALGPASRSRRRSSPTRPGSGCAPAGSSWCRRTASSRGCARSRTRRDRGDPPGLRGLRPRVRGAGAGSGSPAGPSASSPGGSSELLHELGADGPSLRPARRRRARTARARTPSQPTSRSPAGTLVIVDCGCTVDGYCSDCTRTFATGELPDELQRTYDVCLDAQVGALAGVRPGMTGREARRASRAT